MSNGSELDDESTVVMPKLSDGSFFADAYKIEHKISGGGLSTLYRARHLRNGKEVALKLLRPEHQLRSDARERLQREAQILSNLHHENIVEIADCGLDKDGTLWIATEFLHGKTLQDRIRESKSGIEPTEVADIVTEAARGLDFAHRAGVIHRDLKPENIFLTDNSSIKLIDFGLSAMTGAKRITVTGTVLGTPQYCAPELLVSIKAASPKSDVYALALCAFEALCGEAHFTASDYGQLLGAVAQGRRKPINKIRIELRSFDSLFDSALHMDVDQRPNVLDFAREFSQLAKIWSIEKSQRLLVVREKYRSPRIFIAISVASIIVGMLAMWLLLS